MTFSCKQPEMWGPQASTLALLSPLRQLRKKAHLSPLRATTALFDR